MWKGVKGLLKVLKPNDPLPSLRIENDDDIPIQWSNNAAAEVSYKKDTKSDGI